MSEIFPLSSTPQIPLVFVLYDSVGCFFDNFVLTNLNRSWEDKIVWAGVHTPRNILTRNINGDDTNLVKLRRKTQSRSWSEDRWGAPLVHRRAACGPYLVIFIALMVLTNLFDVLTLGSIRRRSGREEGRLVITLSTKHDQGKARSMTFFITWRSQFYHLKSVRIPHHNKNMSISVNGSSF